jgi:hypothetical protein
MQGGGLNDSESWAQALPVTAADGRALLGRLQARLAPRELAIRLPAIVAAHAFIDRCELVGGISAQVRRSFYASGDRQNRRVDVEVIRGVAFVRSPQIIVMVPDGSAQ